VLRSREIAIEVRPLPPPPPEFSGLVGDFRLQAKISKRQLQVGESATFKLTVEGQGNVQMIGEPRVPDLAGFKVYDDKPSGSIERSGSSLAGSRTYNKALVPLQPGEMVIPPIDLVYFYPEEAVYRTSTTEAIALQVSPAEGHEELHLTESLAPSTGKVAVRVLADDILPIYTGLGAVARPVDPPRQRILFLLGVLVPPLISLAIATLQRRRLRWANDVAYQKRRAALRRSRQDLKRIRGLPDDEPNACRLASRCLRQYIGDKLGLEGSALTPAEVDEQLRDHGVEQALVDETHGLLERLEASQYGAASVDTQRLTAELKALIGRLERQIKT
jgi:hypothetical protein